MKEIELSRTMEWRKKSTKGKKHDEGQISNCTTQIYVDEKHCKK